MNIISLTARHNRVDANHNMVITFAIITYILTIINLNIAAENSSLIARIFAAALITLFFFYSIKLADFACNFLADYEDMRTNKLSALIFDNSYDVDEQIKTQQQEAYIMFSGVLANVILSSIFYLLSIINFPPLLSLSFQFSAVFNIMFALLSILPLFPLNGGRVLLAMFNRQQSSQPLTAIKKSVFISRVMGGIIIAFGIFTILINNSIMNGAWILFSGVACIILIKIAYKKIIRATTLISTPLSAVISVGNSIAANTTLESVSNRFLHSSEDVFTVRSDNKIVGTISIADIAKVERDKRSEVAAYEVMRLAMHQKMIHIKSDAYFALAEMRKLNEHYLLVTDNTSIVGVVTENKILNYMEMFEQDFGIAA